MFRKLGRLKIIVWIKRHLWHSKFLCACSHEKWLLEWIYLLQKYTPLGQDTVLRLWNILGEYVPSYTGKRVFTFEWSLLDDVTPFLQSINEWTLQSWSYRWKAYNRCNTPDSKLIECAAVERAENKSEAPEALNTVENLLNISNKRKYFM